jgi:D-alanyl-D-alanine carboxypeptidase
MIRSISNKNTFIIGFITVFFLVLFFTFLNSENITKTKKEKIPVDYSKVLDNIQAKSFYVYDLNEKKVLFAKNEHERLPLASITKLMTGLVAIDVMPNTTIIDIGKNAIMQEGDSGLIVGEKWTLKDLLDFSLITSSNDGIYAIAEALNNYESINGTDAIILMNAKAKELGFSDTVFSNPTGLDIDTQMSGSYSSSCDIAKLLEVIIRNHPEIISKTNSDTIRITSLSNIIHTATNTNEAINDVPGMIASKTGFTDLAGGNLVIAYDAGIMHPIIIVVLGSTQDERFTDIESLANMALQKISED